VVLITITFFIDENLRGGKSIVVSVLDL